jgi:predicted transcriptional regulator of viral defense system
MQTLSVKTDRRTQLVDVTAQVQKAVAASGVVTGICHLYVPHTTAAITINECADKSSMWKQGNWCWGAGKECSSASSMDRESGGCR